MCVWMRDVWMRDVCVWICVWMRDGCVENKGGQEDDIKRIFHHLSSLKSAFYLKKDAPSRKEKKEKKKRNPHHDKGNVCHDRKKASVQQTIFAVVEVVSPSPRTRT